MTPSQRCEIQVFALVLMPFNEAYTDVYELGIKGAAIDRGIQVERIDEQLYQENILDRIYRQIDLADLIIAEMTGRNPNVFYEVGYAHAKNKLNLLLTSDAADIPFDLKHKRHIVYGKSITTLRRELGIALEWAKGEIANARRSSSSRITVKSKAVGVLNRTSDKPVVDVTFRIDLFNDSVDVSPELEAAYFYTAESWNLIQEGRRCPKAVSDVPPFARRHFLPIPVRCLRQPAGWCQIKFETAVALSPTVHELPQTFRTTGQCMLRLVTSSGHFDYAVPYDVSVDDESVMSPEALMDMALDESP